MNVALGLIALVLVAWVAYGAWRFTRVEATMTGVADGASITGAQAEGLRFEFRMPEDRVRSSGLFFDGEDVREDGIPGSGGTLSWSPRGPLAEGPHEIELRVDRPVLPASVFTWSFTIDDTAPALPFPEVQPVEIGSPFELSAKLAPGEQIWIDGEPVAVDADGEFTLAWDAPPVGPAVDVLVRDAAGNETQGSLSLPAAYPEVRGLHLRGVDIADRDLFERVLSLVDTGLINSVEIDLKDEAGLVNYRSSLPEVREVGAAGDYYDLDAIVDELHDHGAHVIGRLVAFNDTQFATAAWEQGETDRVVQDSNGDPLTRGEGMFLNFANPDVREYVSSIAVEAAEAGVDDILLDYVRRPDGPVEEMDFVGLTTTPEEGVVEFLADLQPRLRNHGVYLGASVFGIAAVAPTDIAQDVPAMADYLDYVAPMLYPSHFSEDNYNVPVPNEDPYTIVARSLADFAEELEDRGVALVPWLQDFSYGGVTYDDVKVRAQINAVCDTGVENHLLWNASADYTIEALGACG